MQERRTANFDLIFSPQLRRYLLGANPAVLFNQDMTAILWENAAGAMMMGGRHGERAVELSRDHPLVRQFALAASQIGPEGKIVRGFRIAHNGRSQFIQCELLRLLQHQTGAAVLLTCNDERFHADLPEHELAAATISSLAKMGDGFAIVDRFGLILAADEIFLERDIPQEELDLDAGHPAQESFEQIHELELSLPDGSKLRSTFAPLDGRGERFLIHVQAEGEPGNRRDPHAGEGIDATAVPKHAGNSGAPADQELSLEIDDHEPSDDRPQQALKPATVAGKTEEPARLAPAESPPRQDPLPSGAPPPEGGQHSAAVRSLEPDEKETPAPASGDPTSATHNKKDTNTGSTSRKISFHFEKEADPVRFAWTIDSDGIFRSVSPELSQTVGPNAADIVGRKWKDVANVFGFDPSGDIGKIMQKRDTWSGKSVLWPVQGTDLAVPVDLAALPVFGTARQFEGYRGFGIVRTADAVVDPDETGLALSNATAAWSGARSRGSQTGGSQADRTVSDPDSRAEYSGNVVELPAKRSESNGRPSPDQTLSDSDAEVFAEIGRTLDEEESEAAERHDASQGANGGTAFVSDAVAKKLASLNMPAVIFRGSTLLHANERLLKVCGYSSQEEISAAGGIEALVSAQELDVGKPPAMALIGKDGSEHPVSALLQSVDWDGASALLLTFRRAEQEVPHDETGTVVQPERIRELTSILDTATDGILLIRPDGRIDSGNASAEALFGIRLTDLAGEPLTRLFAPESRQQIDDYIANLSQPGVAGILNDGREVIGLEAKGGLIPMFVTIGSIDNSDKRCVVIRDITQWKKAEEELVTARRVAETASEQKTEFLARVSHEIRTPLNAIIGFSDVMIEERFGPIDNERYREYLRDINRSGIHVLDLINDLLDISKIEAGKMDLSYEAVDLNQVVSETVALLQPQANGERIIIRTSLSRAVPQVVADVRSIRQIILNLVSNAIKFTPMNGQVIVSTVYEGNGEVVLRVRDTGRGMSQNEVEQAMKPFSQIQVTDEKRGQGTGLGLPLTKALVEANRAYFDLESTPGEGTIAHVHFPTQRVLAD